MFITEITPPSLTGPFGVITQFNITLGILISYIVGNFAIPLVDTSEILTSGNWRIVYGFPLIIVCIHVLLLTLVYRSDSPKYYAIKGDKESINRYQNLVYYEADDKDLDLIDDSQEKKLVLDLKITSPVNFKAFIIACILSPVV